MHFYKSLVQVNPTSQASHKILDPITFQDPLSLRLFYGSKCLFSFQKENKNRKATSPTQPTSLAIPLTLEFFKVLGVLSGIAGFLETRDAKGSYMWYSDRMTHARRQCSFSMDSGRKRRGRYASRLQCLKSQRQSQHNPRAQNAKNMQKRALRKPNI